MERQAKVAVIVLSVAGGFVLLLVIVAVIVFLLFRGEAASRGLSTQQVSIGMHDAGISLGRQGGCVRFGDVDV